jgi:hypothetical protein
MGAAAAAVLLMAGKQNPSAAVNPAKVQRFAEAIARAEGWNVSGSRPRRNHNPGNVKVSAIPSVGKDADGHLIFGSDEDGWAALRRQVELIITGRSRYSLDNTIAELAKGYAEWSGNWARNVSSALGVTEGTTLRAVLT